MTGRLNYLQNQDLKIKKQIHNVIKNAQIFLEVKNDKFNQIQKEMLIEEMNRQKTYKKRLQNYS